MNIAHIIPHSVGYPLPSHNGRYDWVYELAVRQAAAGHTVTIYGSPDSHVKGVRTIGISDATDDIRRNNIETFSLAFRAAHDIYHSHFDNLHYGVAHETSRPIIFTQHWWPTEETIQAATTYPAKNVWAVPPTDFMYEHDKISGIQSKGFIYHGIDLTIFKPSVIEKTDRLLFVGRISPEKNLDLAIKVAKMADTKLDIIGKVAKKNEGYWQSLQPLIDGETIRYLGTKNHKELINYYSSAHGVLFPSDINEPFGLVAIEAQACGTPVIMKRGGSRGELIEDSLTGFLCDDPDSFVSAIHSLKTIKSKDCVTFAGRFDITTMIKQYEQLYTQLLTN